MTEEECVKHANFVLLMEQTISSMLQSLPDVTTVNVTTFATMSPSRHTSLQIKECSDITGNCEKELDCIDLNTDCNQQICKDYPYTAKARCAKTCGFCRQQVIDRSDTRTNIDDRYLSHTDSRQRGRISELDERDGLRRGKVSGTAGRSECKDQDPQCSQQSCLDQPYNARTKCAKTCGFCGEKIDLESPAADNLDRGSMITLDNDDSGSSFRESTSRYRPTSGIGDDKSTQHSRHSSISSRTDSVRKPSSSSTFIQQPTMKTSSEGILRRYPGRTGPCIDTNQYCEKADCRKYPRFAQKYCEKTCNYC